MSHRTEHITIAGAGLLGAWHLSREAAEALRSARVVFCSTYNKGIAEHVRSLNPAAVVRFSEENEYKLGMYRPEMYRRMAKAVLEAASAGPGVVVLAPGSAVVVDRVTQCILDGAHGASIRVRILPGISSIESVLAEVGYEVSGGLQVMLAQRLVLHRLELNPFIASIVLQPGYFDTLYFVGAPRALEGRYDALEQQLARTLSPEAPMALVITPTEVDAEPSVFWFRLGALSRLYQVLSPQHTLFVPPERPALTCDAFAARIASWDACLSHVEVDGRGAVLQQKNHANSSEVLDVASDLRAESAVLAERWRSRAR